MIRGDALSTAGFTAGGAVARPLTPHPHSLAWGRPGDAIARIRIRCDSHRRFALQLPGLHDRPHTTSRQRRRAIHSPVQPNRGPGQQRYRLGDLFPRASRDQTSQPHGRSQVELRTTRQAGGGAAQANTGCIRTNAAARERVSHAAANELVKSHRTSSPFGVPYRIDGEAFTVMEREAGSSRTTRRWCGTRTPPQRLRRAARSRRRNSDR